MLNSINDKSSSPDSSSHLHHLGRNFLIYSAQLGHLTATVLQQTGVLTFSHRVAHDEIGPGGKGVNSAGVHLHLVFFQLAVHVVESSSRGRLIVFVSAACLVTDAQPHPKHSHLPMALSKAPPTCKIKIFGFPTRLLHLSPLNRDAMSWMLILSS